MTRAVPKVVIVGTTDVDARIELMQRLRPEFEPGAIGSTEEQRDRFDRAGLPYRVCALSRRVSPLQDWKTYRELVRAFREIKPDVVHTFDTKPCVWARLAACAAGVPVVVGTITGLGAIYATRSIMTRLLSAVYEPLQRRASHRSNMTLFYNPDDADQFTKSGVVPADRSAVINGSGIRTDLFRRDAVTQNDLSRVARDAGIGDEDVVVTMIARVCRSKGVLEFADAADRFREDDKRFRFILVGPEDEAAWDRLTAAELDRVRGAVTWLGERNDVATVLAASSICVLPTYYREGIPRALIEAASMGLPLVATDMPGCREIVRPGVNGHLVAKHDLESLVGAIRRLAGNEDEARRYGAASREIAVNEFDISVIAREIREVYRTCLDP